MPSPSLLRQPKFGREPTNMHPRMTSFLASLLCPAHPPAHLSGRTALTSMILARLEVLSGRLLACTMSRTLARSAGVIFPLSSTTQPSSISWSFDESAPCYPIASFRPARSIDHIRKVTPIMTVGFTNTVTILKTQNCLENGLSLKFLGMKILSASCPYPYT